jgi:hypothetical protein
MSAMLETVPPGPLDAPMAVTFFRSYAADQKAEERFTLRSLASRIEAVTAGSKAQLPWLKLARFGEIRTDKNSLRHDGNMLAISGIEADYDAEQISPDDAAAMLEQAGIAAMVYTSPSHSEDSPRWRVLCPVSVELPPTRRQHLLGRLNGLFRGALAGESFTLSQSYYFGSVKHNPSHRAILIDGTPIDQHDELDEIWIGRPNTAPARPGAPVGQSGPVNPTELLANLMAGADYHQATVRLAGLLARQSLPPMEARTKLRDAMEAVPSESRDARWRARYADLDRVIFDIYGREAAKRDREPERGPPPAPVDDEGYWASVEADAAMSQADWSELEHRETGAAIPSSPAAAAHAGPDLLWTIRDAWDEAAIPVRPWVARGYLMRRSVTVVSGPGSAGKSSLMVAWATALAVGCPFHGLRLGSPYRVATYNVEDDADEQKRRFSAMLQQLKLPASAFGDRLAILGPARVGTLLHTARDGSLLVNTPVMDRLESFVADFRPDVLMLDPFVELHAAEENDNTAVRAVMARFRAMAIEHDMSVVLLHHARKGSGEPGDPDSLRGASSIVGAARVALTLNVMTPEEASAFGLNPEKRRNYFRLDGAKNNYAPIEDAEWFERVERRLGNGGSSDGDSVAVAWPWKPKGIMSQQNPADLNMVLDRIQAGFAPGVMYAPSQAGASNERWAGHVIRQMLDVTDAQAALMISAWLKTGLLRKVIYHDPARRQDRPGLEVDNSKRPT